jgi:hypothetical protein
MACAFQLGLPVFFVIRTLVLRVVAIVGITGAWSWNRSNVQVVGVGAVGALIGGRLADSWKSHIELSRKGLNPNPGLASIPLYIAETAALAVIFAPGLIHNWRESVAGLAIGISLFWLFVPASLRLLAIVFPRHDLWVAGQPMPNWAQE